MNFTFKREYMTIRELAELFSFSRAGILNKAKQNGFRMKWDKENSEHNARWLISTEDFSNYLEKLNSMYNYRSNSVPPFRKQNDK